MIPSDPTFDLMKLIVCTKRLRPTLPSRWKNDEVRMIFAVICLRIIHFKKRIKFSILYILFILFF